MTQKKHEGSGQSQKHRLKRSNTRKYFFFPPKSNSRGTNTQSNIHSNNPLFTWPAMATSAAMLSDRRRVAPTVDIGTETLFTDNSGGNCQKEKHSHKRKNGHRHQPTRQRSFTQDIGHFASEVNLVTRLSFTLLRYLGY